jgi:glycosyltransferase involved in cell wall biosynthesis
MAIPTVCFRHSGGIAELADQGYGVPIDYLDLDAFAAALVHLQQQPELRHALGKGFQEKVFRSNTVATQAAEIAALIDGTNNRNPSLNSG